MLSGINREGAMPAERDLSAMSDQEYKVLENRLRRMLDRQGYRLLKSRARDPRAITYGGYMIVDHEVGGAAAGGEGRGYTLDLNDVERWATG
jgi:hypothetical protein